MQFMLIMRDEDAAAVQRRDGPFDEMMARMGRYNAAMADAGVLVTAQGLTPPDAGIVLDFSADPPLITDGPYGETKELFNGFWIIEVGSRDAAIEWAARAPLGAGTRLELRQLHGETDLQR